MPFASPDGNGTDIRLPTSDYGNGDGVIMPLS